MDTQWEPPINAQVVWEQVSTAPLGGEREVYHKQVVCGAFKIKYLKYNQDGAEDQIDASEAGTRKNYFWRMCVELVKGEWKKWQEKLDVKGPRGLMRPPSVGGFVGGGLTWIRPREVDDFLFDFILSSKSCAIKNVYFKIVNTRWKYNFWLYI